MKFCKFCSQPSFDKLALVSIKAGKWYNRENTYCMWYQLRTKCSPSRRMNEMFEVFEIEQNHVNLRCFGASQTNFIRNQMMPTAIWIILISYTSWNLKNMWARMFTDNFIDWCRWGRCPWLLMISWLFKYTFYIKQFAKKFEIQTGWYCKE